MVCKVFHCVIVSNVHELKRIITRNNPDFSALLTKKMYIMKTICRRGNIKIGNLNMSIKE